MLIIVLLINNENLETFNCRRLVILIFEYTTDEIGKVLKSYVEGWGIVQREFT